MLTNCKDCGKLVAAEKNNLCSGCAAVRDEEMVRIRDCIRLSSSLTIVELSKKTGIPTGRLIQFMNEGLIEIK